MVIHDVQPLIHQLLHHIPILERLTYDEEIGRIYDDLVDDFKSYTSLNLTNCDVYGSDSVIVSGLVQGSHTLGL